MTENPPKDRDEVAAALRASRELGPEYDEAIAAALVDRVDDTIDERVRHHVARQGQRDDVPRGLPPTNVRMVLSIVCLGLALPLTAVAGHMAGGGGVFVTWMGLIVFYLVSVGGLRR
ncbi:hypothetical protein [Nocardiopsis sp. MG754419]|uniref:hypothetical protein n=1 Tax=Nocardiopsis sp. MG754419 TaxID=2259865 RepID=UPI001BAB865C|nr:hypothetical protein [Nocardiopsis sp. MG754419]MBR8740875.1 hypothetical protein [Nocardiopsis sp. MG754419]